jgi:hypothetical protein
MFAKRVGMWIKGRRGFCSLVAGVEWAYTLLVGSFLVSFPFTLVVMKCQGRFRIQNPACVGRLRRR